MQKCRHTRHTKKVLIMPAIFDLLHQKGIAMKRVAATHGGEYVGPCPLCGGEDRFHVWPEEGRQGKWWCRRCNKGGDLIQYLMDVQGMPYPDACLEAGVEPAPIKKTFDWSDNKSKGKTWKPREISSPPATWIEKCSAFVDYCQNQLWECPEALHYLQNKRGLDDCTIETLCLGFNPQNLHREREFWGLPCKLRPDGTKQDIWIPRGIVIPCFADGVLQRVRIRRLDGQWNTPASGPPYCVLSGSTSATMVLGDCSQVVTVVESEFDALLLHQELEAEGPGGVIALGSASVRPDQRCTEMLKTSKIILVALDDDEAGARQAQWWAEHFSQARRLPPIEGKDPGEMWTNGVSLQEWVQAGIQKYFLVVRKSRTTQQSAVIPIDQKTFESKVDPKMLEQIAAQKVEEVANIYPEGCWAWIEIHRPDIPPMVNANDQYLNEIWELCEAGKSSLNDFLSAYDIWVDGLKQMIEAYKQGYEMVESHEYSTASGN